MGRLRFVSTFKQIFRLGKKRFFDLCMRERGSELVYVSDVATGLTYEVATDLLRALRTLARRTTLLAASQPHHSTKLLRKNGR
jgi:hypothetical protein